MDPCRTEDSKEDEVRCICHRLISVVNGDDIEIKCPKCKRIAIISTKGIQGFTFE